MKKFIEKHKDIIHGVLVCVDRIIFKGYSLLSNSQSMENYLSYKSVLIKDFPYYAKKLSKIIKEHALNTALNNNRPYFKPRGKYNKEELAQRIVREDNITHGLVCVISAMEASPTFKKIYGEKHPRLKNEMIPHLAMYYYFMDRMFGLMHVRIQTYLPFTSIYARYLMYRLLK